MACLSAVAGPEADLDVFKGHTLYVIPAKETLTFEHTYTWWGESGATGTNQEYAIVDCHHALA
jgi:hypothetical protein